jgi:hypothetical protein
MISGMPGIMMAQYIAGADFFPLPVGRGKNEATVYIELTPDQ